MKQKLRVCYPNLPHRTKHAEIETRDGTYVCTVECCLEEGEKRFRRRVRRIRDALERYPDDVLRAGT